MSLCMYIVRISTRELIMRPFLMCCCSSSFVIFHCRAQISRMARAKRESIRSQNVMNTKSQRSITMTPSSSQRGLYQCACGKVKMDLTISPPGFGTTAPISMLCSCRDCVSFAQKVCWHLTRPDICMTDGSSPFSLRQYLHTLPLYYSRWLMHPTQNTM